MSDSGSPSSFTRRVSSAERVLQASAEGQKTGGRLAHTPEEFKRDERKPTRLNGEVVEERKDRDGQTKRIVIRTAQGDVEVERDGSKPLPQKGQKVEIEIQPKRSGQAIENVIIRTDNTARPAQTPVQPPSPENLRTSATPVDVQISGELQSQSAPLPQTGVSIDEIALTTPVRNIQAFIDAGTPLRFTSIDPAVLDQNILSAFYEVLQVNNLPDLLTVSAFSAPALQIDADVPALQTSNIFSYDSVQAALPNNLLVSTEQAGQNLPKIQETQLVLPEFSTPVASTSLEPATVLSEFFANVLPDFVQGPIQAVQTQGEILSPVTQALPDHIMVRVESVSPPLPVLTLPEVEGQNIKGLPLPVAEEGPVPASSLLSETQAGSLQAVITGQAADKLPTMSVFFARTEGGQTFMFHAPVDSFEPGMQITFTPVSDVPLIQHTEQNLAPVPLSVFMQSSPVWPSLTELVPVLATMNPQVAQALSSIAPNPGNAAQLPPALMLFVAAVRGGDLSTWLGDKTMDIIRRSGRGDIMGRIGQEASLLARMSGGPISGDWHGMNVPMFWDGEFQKAAFYYRDHEEEGAEGAEGKRRKYTRFIFDLSLSNMGGVQVDGLLRAERLDIILRTEKMLSQEMQRDMRRVYTQALGQTEFTGELSFQSDPRKWVTITPDERHIGVEA